MNYAIIKNEEVVEIVGMSPTNYEQFSTIVQCHANVKISDKYKLGNFYRDGQIVLSPEEMDVAALLDEISSLCEELVGE